ncbi:MAG: hypothetical protein R3C15_00955 [Thermoleophilia bacterium]
MSRARIARRLPRPILVPALALFAVLAVVLRLGPYALAMVQQEASSPTGTQLASAPYSKRGPQPVGVRRLAVDPAIARRATIWYPARPAEDAAPGTTYAYELTLFAPLGRLAIATHRGDASRDVPPDLESGPYPLVVLSPGYAIGSGAYAWLAEHLASYGLVVVSPEPDEELNPSLIWRSTITRPRAMRDLLAQLDEQSRPGEALHGLIDPLHTAVIGHSYGGYTALAAAGARLDTDAFQARCDAEHAAAGPNRWLCDALTPHSHEMAELAGLASVPSGLWPAWKAPGVDAIVSMAGDAYLFDRAGLAEISVPVLAIGGTADTDTPYSWGTQPTYDFTSSAMKAKVTLHDAGHMVFTGPCNRVRRLMTILPGGFCADSSWDRGRAQALVRHYTTAFLLAQLRGDASATAELARADSPLPDVSYETRR